MFSSSTRLTSIIAAAVCGVCFSLVSGSARSAGSTTEAKISRLYLSAVGSVRVLRIELAAPRVNPDNCTGNYTNTEYPNGQTFLIRELDDSKASAQFLSMVQLAYATNSKVQFWLSGCTSVSANYWGQSWPVPLDIYMSK